jgi:MFS family permease
LAVTPLWLVVLVNVLLYVGVASRMISASALMSAIPNPLDRGSFMSISASIQQISGGVAATVGGLIVTQTVSGALEHFDVVGYVLTATSLLSVVMMYFINRRIGSAAALATAAT